MRHPLEPSSPAVAAGQRHTELIRALLRGYELDAESENDAVRFLGSLATPTPDGTQISVIPAVAGGC